MQDHVSFLTVEASSPSFWRLDFLSFVLELRETTITSSLPALDLLHAALLLESLVQVKAVEEQVRLVAPALAQALELGLVEVALEDGLVVGVGALVDDDAGALLGGQTADVGKTGLGHDHVEVVLGLVDVRAHGHDTADAVGIRLGGPGRGRVHDGVF